MKVVVRFIRKLFNKVIEPNPCLSFMNSSIASPKGKDAKLAYIKKIETLLKKPIENSKDKSKELSISEKRFLENAYKVGHKGDKTLKLTDAQKYGSLKAYLEGANGIGRIKAQVKQYNALVGS